MDSIHSKILEGLNNRRLEEVESEPTSLNESIEFDSLFSDPSINKIDEAKRVTFKGSSYPKYGWAVVMAGGAGSGKGFTIDKQVLIDAKVVDVDHMKSVFAKVSAKGGDTEIAKKTGGKKYDFKNSEDVSDLHAIIGTELELDAKNQANLMKSMLKSPELTNLIFDITGKSSTKLMNIAKTCKSLGYSTTIIWVVTNRQVAMLRNLMRERVVGERLFHEIHNQVNDVLMDFLTSSDAKDYDEGWIVFSSSPDVTDLSKEAQDKLFNDSVFKLKKTGSSFVIDDDLNKKVIEFLGPKEVNPKKPQTYVSFDTVKSKIKPYQKDEMGNVTTKPKGYKNLSFMNK